MLIKLIRKIKKSIKKRNPFIKKSARHSGPVSSWLTSGDDIELSHGELALRKSIANRLYEMEKYKKYIESYKFAKSKRTGSRERVVVYTAIVGSYDSLKLPEVINSDFDYVVFSDMALEDTGVWDVVPITFFHEDDTRTARFIKTHPHHLLSSYDVAIWIDSNVMIIGDMLPLFYKYKESGFVIGAIPHRSRSNVFQEAEACHNQSKDDLETMQRQLDLYRSKGFYHDDLIESNFLIMNLRDSKLIGFLNAWWNEIDCFSRRDQLSVNYAMQKIGIDWLRLMDKPDNVRTYDAFAYVAHDSGKGPAASLLHNLRVPKKDPYFGPNFSSVKAEVILNNKSKKIDIIVCVHNALEDVEKCLESIALNRKSNLHNLIIIDDGSDAPTARYLDGFVNGVEWAELRRNAKATGYTKAANLGLSVSTGELVILLNSDTVVTDGWVEKMADAVFSTPGAGIVGPMSNAASYQSLPDVRASLTQTAVNELPPELGPEKMNMLCEAWTTVSVLPRVQLVHGFCFGITRNVIEAVGSFDEKNFPKGYGEENDYCLRAQDFGFGLVLATHTFIYHSKSKSYQDDTRIQLAKQASEALVELHGAARILRAKQSMERHKMLHALRVKALEMVVLAPHIH